MFLTVRKTFNIYQSVGAEFGGLEKQKHYLHRILTKSVYYQVVQSLNIFDWKLKSMYF